jgi:hypothetical protein
MSQINKTTQYALVGFGLGFILAAKSCGSSFNDETQMTFGIFGGVFFAILGAIIGSNVEKKDNIGNNNEPNSNTISQLEKLKKLKDEGVITEEEFNVQKKKILS